MGNAGIDLDLTNSCTILFVVEKNCELLVRLILIFGDVDLIDHRHSERVKPVSRNQRM